MTGMVRGDGAADDGVPGAPAEAEVSVRALGGQIAAFLANHSGFETLPWRDSWRAGVGGKPPASADGSETALLLTPARHGTDGFFIAVLRRRE